MNEPDLNTQGGRLKHARQAASLSAAALGAAAARAAGRDRPFVSSMVRNVEYGINGLRPEAARAFGQVLGVKPEWLLFGDGGPDGVGSPPRFIEVPPPKLSQGAALLAVRGLVASAEHGSPEEAAQLKELAAWLSKRAFA